MTVPRILVIAGGMASLEGRVWQMSGSVATRRACSATKYQPSPEEGASVQSINARRQHRPPSPKLTINRSGKTAALGHDHPDLETGWLLLMNALGTTDVDFTEGLVSQLFNAGTVGENFDSKGANFMLAVIRGIAPKDEVEAMIAAQMAAVHMATMKFARRLNHVDNIQQQDAAERAFNKLARTFTVQVEALKRYRTGGEQRVIVQHVTVNEGGQAIVGPVSSAPAGGGGRVENS
jgi:hypothetical protein